MKKKKKPYQITQAELRKKLDSLKNVVEIQKGRGTCDISPYMHGMANGLILALSIMEDTEPEFIDRIKTYLCDTKNKGKKNVRNKRSRRRK